MDFFKFFIIEKIAKEEMLINQSLYHIGVYDKLYLQIFIFLMCIFLMC